MKLRRTLKLAVISLLCLMSLQLHAQVTIGSGEEPIFGSLLQLKEKIGVTDDAPNSTKGMVLPRVTLSEKEELYPMFLTNPNDPTSGPNAEYTANKMALDKSHTGLIVYNLEENDDKDLCLGLNQWDGKQWNCFEQKPAVAQFDPIECSDIKVYGSYVQGIAVNGSNYISFKVNVRKAGAFTITITTGNGYNFSISGVAVAPGDFDIDVPAQGTPVASGVNTITVTGLPIEDETCLPTITVSPPTATYSIDCGRIAVNGVYKVNTPLVLGTNTVTLYITVTKATAMAGNYTITTNIVDGLYFKGTGSVSAPGTYPVILQAYGTVESSKIKKFILTTDSADGSATCEFELRPVIPAKKVYVYGSGYYRITNTPQRNMLQSQANFGPNGTFKYEGFSTSNLVDRSADNTTLINDLGSANPPDIIHVTYPMAISSDGATAIVNFAKKGGVVIMTIEDSPTIVNLMNGIFNISNTVSDDTASNPHNPVFTLPYINEDPIINGPFGNLGGQNIGWDGCCNDLVKNLPMGDIIKYSGDNYVGNYTETEGVISSFRHKTLNILFFADGGTFACEAGTSYTYYYPIRVGSSPDYRPLSKGYSTVSGGTTANTTVVNSFFLCNAMVWALEQSQYYGINSANYK